MGLDESTERGAVIHRNRHWIFQRGKRHQDSGTEHMNSVAREAIDALILLWIPVIAPPDIAHVEDYVIGH